MRLDLLCCNTAACPYLILPLCLLVLSAENIYANVVDPDQARQNVGFDLTPKRFNFQKNDFEKYQRTTKNREIITQ